MKKVLLIFVVACCLGFAFTPPDNNFMWLGNQNTTGAQQNPLSLGNWSGGGASTTPQYQFYTTDLGSQPLTIHSTRYSGGLIVSRGGPSGNVSLATISGWDGFGTSMEIYNGTGASNIRFSTSGSDNYINTGNLAIGTTNALGYKLAVNGSAIFTSAKVKLFSQWPDYVFAPTYSLRPLSEVEKYIKKHQHLPEVPSAKEVKQNGLDLGANQEILLKKIEELTLYVIAQQKEIDALKNELKK
jgi:hypothetical protein